MALPDGATANAAERHSGSCSVPDGEDEKVRTALWVRGAWVPIAGGRPQPSPGPRRVRNRRSRAGSSRRPSSREPDEDVERGINLGSSKIHILNHGPRPGGAGWASVDNETRTAGRHDGGRTSWRRAEGEPERVDEAVAVENEPYARSVPFHNDLYLDLNRTDRERTKIAFLKAAECSGVRVDCPFWNKDTGRKRRGPRAK